MRFLGDASNQDNATRSSLMSCNLQAGVDDCSVFHHRAIVAVIYAMLVRRIRRRRHRHDWGQGQASSMG